ncbi:unnamed protein product [Adineta steineri]|uniref:Uncharacterized protein n=1 Tax=Adineta steineri TaxID=433720 RepID=A0A814XLD6_9BILA|nr:unnamed protein product [Adineta steineri]CAF1222849.1 unnamed protein product [Adineta steineri]CAF3744429.1 unnamed protein product [Adineta steineri]CAF3960466.1 unnamed protein product [Adineta steineri]
MTINYTTYMDPNTNETYYVYIGALTVLGAFDNYDLNYYCPPDGYNGAGGDGCTTLLNTQLCILYINTLDEKLYGIDIILSGTPFPSPSTLQANQPPFGKATHKFDSGITIKSTGYLQICKSTNSNRCPSQYLVSYKIPNPFPSNTGYGIYGVESQNLITNSVWILDDPNQLLIVTAGNYYYYFNASGFFQYDYNSNKCVWNPNCNYTCEVYNYDSRYLDYAGEWVITKKWGIDNIEPTVVNAWIGLAIDAAGVFPVILYTHNQTNHYVGFDKLDTTPGNKKSATYWYIVHKNTILRTSIEGFHPNVEELGCANKLRDWTGIKNNTLRDLIGTKNC